MHRDGNALAIDYSNLDLDKAGLPRIMDLAAARGFLCDFVDVDAFSDVGLGVRIHDPAESTR